MRLAASIYALPLLGRALADCGVDGGTIVVANPNYDILDELEACSTIYGDILVDPAFVYFFLDGPQEITGTLIAHDNSILKDVSLPNATHLGGFSFASPQINGRVNFPEVTKIDNLEWRNITFIYDDFYEWHAPKLIAVSNLNVEATDLSGFLPDYPSFDGFYYDGLPQLETADNIRVVDNQRMNNVVFSGLKTVSGSVLIGNNIDYNSLAGKRDVDERLISFPALEAAGSVVFYDTDAYSPGGGSIELPVLGHVYGDFNVTNTAGFMDVSAPELTDIDGGLYITGVRALETVDFSALKRVGHVVLDANDENNNDVFQKILFPALEQVGSFRVHSPASEFDCSSLSHIRDIASDFSCSSPGSASEPDTPPSSSELPTPDPTSFEVPPPSSVSSFPPPPPPTPTNEPILTSEPATLAQPSVTSIESIATTEAAATTAQSSTTSESSRTTEHTSSAQSTVTHESSLTTESSTTVEPSSTTSEPIATVSSTNTNGSATTEGADSIPSSETTAYPSATIPVVSVSSKLRLPPAAVALLVSLCVFL